MKPFKRTVEKVLAWIANIILIVITGFLSYGSFFKVSLLKDNQEFLNLFKDELAKNPNGVNLSAEQLLDYTIQGLKMYSVLLIVLVVVALLASFLMKKRILSGILFLLLAIVVAVGTVGVLIPVYLLYFIVAIMLFVRKENPAEYQETVNYL
ncbi:hypothetical protein HMPREF3186_01286 [Gemella haemolysans]|jgi:hypothetical protein|uniref:DUF4064 domain-containing protein n=1 Tax=Gemella haemolysans TaxID=1379 RepID=A0A133ZUF2_9BACL|nr:DUF4064 domain-containing protein [Gemella haemolysans]KXB59061.1 hypothetical protein HMPREF3186_01286 [Gemella haemolysans]